MEWYLKAADQGSIAVQLHISTCVPQDHRKSMEWFLKAADQGNADAQFSIGRLYDSGLGVSHDYHKAMKWYGIWKPPSKDMSKPKRARSQRKGEKVLKAGAQGEVAPGRGLKELAMRKLNVFTLMEGNKGLKTKISSLQC